MKSRNAVIFALIAAFCSGPDIRSSFAQQAAPPPAVALDAAAQLIQRLPEDWRPTAARYHAFSAYASSYASMLKQSDDDLRFTALSQLAGKPGAEEFVAAHLDEELATSRPSKYRIRLLYGVAYSQNWTNNPLTIPLLEREAASNPDPDLSLAAVKGLHVVEVRRLEAAVAQRLRAVSWDYKNHKDEVDQLEAEDQKLLYAGDEIVLPEFMEAPPAVFSVPVRSNAIRVAMMGDFGTRGEDQRKVAAAMVVEHHRKPFDFGLTLGDNFYFDLKSPDDPALKVAFEDLYGPMNITFYPCFGNHDWGGETPEIEMQYSTRNPHWHLPAPYYTYTAGPVQFFVINNSYLDSNGYYFVPPLQLRWLQTELDKSTAKWKIVYGHVPIYGDWPPDPSPMLTLMPILKGRADVFISGHVHNLEQHKSVEGVNFFTIGASGRGEVPVDASDPDTIFAKEAYGFGVLEANDHNLTIRILGEDGKELHAATFHK